MRSGRLALTLVLMVAALCSSAGQGHAQLPGHNPWKESQTTWLGMDKCKRQAFQQFPDYTKEGDAKRERAVQQCLRASNLPPLPPQSSGESSEATGR